jgi:hypothetical protein
MIRAGLKGNVGSPDSRGLRRHPSMKTGVDVHRAFASDATSFYSCSKAHKDCPELGPPHLSKVLEGQG